MVNRACNKVLLFLVESFWLCHLGKHNEKSANQAVQTMRNVRKTLKAERLSRGKKASMSLQESQRIWPSLPTSLIAG